MIADVCWGLDGLEDEHCEDQDCFSHQPLSIGGFCGCCCCFHCRDCCSLNWTADEEWTCSNSAAAPDVAMVSFSSLEWQDPSAELPAVKEEAAAFVWEYSTSLSWKVDHSCLDFRASNILE